MKLRGLLLLCVPLAAGCTGPPDPVSVRSELETMYETDQRHRRALHDAITRGGLAPDSLQRLAAQQQELDRQNLERLDAIVAASGWPKRNAVGDRAAAAAFLIVQHADLATQQRYLPVLRAAVAEGEASPSDLALLEDRILMRQGRQQRYGSQLREKPGGGWELHPIEDAANVDDRRRAVGLEPLADYARRFGIELPPR